MRHTVRAALALAALLSLSTLAHAGPIRWGYRADANDYNHVLREVRNLTALTWSDNFLPDPRQFGVPEPDPDFTNGVLTSIFRSDARVSIIDEPSGLWGEVFLSAVYIRKFRIRSDGTEELIFEGAGDESVWTQTVTLGGNRYTVRSPRGEFLVTISPVNTPEPGTLALAAIGLGAVLARRLRRPRVSRGAVTGLLVCLGLFGAGGSASAGPIEWGYSGTVRTSNGTGALDLGTARLFVDPSGNGTAEPVFNDYKLTAPLGAGTFTGVGTGNDSVSLFSVGWGWRADLASEAPAADPGFVVAFTLTDSASGQSKTVEFTGRAGASATNEYLPLVLFSASMGPGAEFTLGGNRYRLTPIEARPDEIEDPATLGLRVEAAPVAATPEPGTLALAGVGLIGVFARRVRRVLVSRGTVVAALAAFGVFGGAGGAQAGPIGWSYYAEFGPVDPYGPYGSSAPDVRYGYYGYGRLGLGTVAGPDGRVEVSTRFVSNYDEGSGTGSRLLNIGMLIAENVYTDSPTPFAPIWQQFRSDFTITDAASGEVGGVSVFGRGVYFGDDLLLAPQVRLELDGDGRRELTLGGNKYAIAHSIEQWEGDRFSSLYVDVTVSPVATPEPGTLALAAVGLGAVFARRLRWV